MSRFVALLFFTPAFMIFCYWGAPQFLSLSDSAEPVYWILIQATASAGASILAGLLGALGLCALPERKWRIRFSLVLLIPTIAPTLSVLLALVITFGWVYRFPFGIYGVVLAHAFLNGSWLSIVFFEAIRQRLGGQAESALVLGISRFRFLVRVLVPQLQRLFLALFSLVFAMSAVSYAVPSLLGNGSIQSVDLWIQQLIRREQGSQFALGLFAIEAIVLAVVGLFSAKSFSSSTLKTFNLKIIGSPFGFVFWALIVLITSIALLTKGILNLQSVFSRMNWLAPALATAMISLSVGVLVGLFLAILSMLSPRKILRRAIFAQSSLPIVLWGLTLAAIGSLSLVASATKIVIGLIVIYLPLLYRWWLDEPIERLSEQIQMASTLGASRFLSWRRIILPQIITQIKWAASVAAFWSAGEYALSALVSGSDFTLALMSQSLLTRYQIDESAALALVIMFVGLCSAITTQGVLDVACRKLTT